MRAITIPNTAKKRLDDKHLKLLLKQSNTVVSIPYAAVMACAKNPALITAPRTATIQNAAKSGKRFKRKGGREYMVPRIPDPHNATFNP
eukprot:CAMPEP_0176501714 /NCGR_PEP_ID=MMETSP0200_2-20121128/14323_1 /TAXON_ID=947934 /ORGANISM="Chaetoceros sp., Strain GSL56" /LENGTH=88 /DNA_ID=CAMNT_0017900649 /DNA_START=258 /DNA_END=524 /DNA_ORIENTATION=-